MNVVQRYFIQVFTTYDIDVSYSISFLLISREFIFLETVVKKLKNMISII